MNRTDAGTIAMHTATATSIQAAPADDAQRSAVGASTKVLLVAYHFPPSAAVGGLRVARFARFLPEFGCTPYVLTVLDSDRDQSQGRDTTRLTGLDAVPIYRTHARSGSLSMMYLWLKSLVKGNHPPATGDPIETGSMAMRPPAPDHDETPVHRLKRYVTSLLLMLPDDQKGWALASAFTAARLVRKQRIDWVLTSGPPFSVHLIGLIVRAFTSCRWVADFRDPWVEMLPERLLHTRSQLSDWLETRMESLVFNHADKVLTTTDHMRRSMMARHTAVPIEKFEWIPNGIDLDQVVCDTSKKEPVLTITYAGSLYFERTPEPLFQALGELVREGRAKATDFQIKLVGSCHHIGALPTLEVAQRHGIESSVEIHDWLSRGDAVRLMQSSHLLLVLAPPNHHLVLPAKVFDYLGSGSKILALAEPGATADFVRETNCGRSFLTTDVSGLKAYFAELLEGGRYRYLRNDPSAFSRYDAKRLSAQLATLLTGQSVPTDK